MGNHPCVEEHNNFLIKSLHNISSEVLCPKSSHWTRDLPLRCRCSLLKNNAIECTLVEFMDYTKLGKVKHLGKSCYSGDLNKLTKKVWQDLMKFNKNKYQVLNLGGKISLQQYGLGSDQLENSSSEKSMGIVTDKSNISQQCALAEKKAQEHPGQH